MSAEELVEQGDTVLVSIAASGGPRVTDDLATEEVVVNSRLEHGVAYVDLAIHDPDLTDATMCAWLTPREARLVAAALADAATAVDGERPCCWALTGESDVDVEVVPDPAPAVLPSKAWSVITDVVVFGEDFEVEVRYPLAVLTTEADLGLSWACLSAGGVDFTENAYIVSWAPARIVPEVTR